MASPTRQRHHALAIPVPAVGHGTPLIRFCKRLASQQAFTVTIVNIQPSYEQAASSSSDPIDQWLRLLGKHGAHANSAPSVADLHKPVQQEELIKQEHQGRLEKLDIRRTHIPLDLSKLEDFSQESFFGAVENLAPLIDELLSKLILEDPPITCLISDLYMTGPTQRVADKFNLPRIAFNTASHSVLLFTHYIQQGQVSLDEVLKVVVRKEALKEDTFVEGLLGLPTLKNGDLLDYLDDNLFLYPLHSRILEESKGKACALVVNSFEELEGSALNVDIGFPIYAIGPLMEPLEKENSISIWEEDEGCMQWLNEQPLQSVLYISFGSFSPLSNAQFEEIVFGLLSSQQRFLWVFRSNLVKDASYPSFPAEWLAKSNGRGYSTEWVPQLRVLAHPSVGGFLTHCGWNSTIEAMSFGVPMICFPYISDQFMNAKFITEEWKIGFRFKTCKENGLVERDEVERVIRALMVGEEGKLVKRNVEHLKEVCYHKLACEATSSKTIQALVDSLR